MAASEEQRVRNQDGEDGHHGVSVVGSEGVIVILILMVNKQAPKARIRDPTLAARSRCRARPLAVAIAAEQFETMMS